jgi:hypothetical protein
MNPLTHLLTRWVVANAADLTPRDRALVTMSGVVPDIDGIGIVAEIATEQTTRFLPWWSKYHHVFCHNLGFGLLLGIIVLLAATRRWMSVFLALTAFHLHTVGDLLGSKGPDGYQ